MTKLDKAIFKTFFECLNVKPKESLLILTDVLTRNLAQQFFEKALKAKIEALLLETSPLNSRSPEPSAAVLKIVKQTSAVLTLTSFPLIHSKLVKQVCYNGARILCLKPLSILSLQRALNVDYKLMGEKSHRIADLLSIGREIRVSTKAGTNFVFKVNRHKSSSNTGVLKGPGDFDYLPAGEATVTPDRNTTNGVIIIDGSIPPHCMVEHPLELNVKDGYVYQIFGDETAEKIRKILKPYGKNSRNIAEFGIGTNPGAALTGESIEDEKVLGTAHVALGHHLLEGGSQQKKLHLDFVFRKPSVEIDGRLIIKNGKLI